MIKSHISILLLLISFNIYSQEYQYVPFPTENAIWSEIYYFPVFTEPPVYERFALSGEDTIIENITYKKLYIFYDTIFDVNNATCIGGIREDSAKRIYYKSDNYVHEDKPMKTYYPGEEQLLYDFNLNVGDTLFSGNFLPYIDILI
ncbi:hypothetical protein ACFLTE_10215, partial [Bacteroidota bacterium]